MRIYTDKATGLDRIGSAQTEERRSLKPKEAKGIARVSAMTNGGSTEERSTQRSLAKETCAQEGMTKISLMFSEIAINKAHAAGVCIKDILSAMIDLAVHNASVKKFGFERTKGQELINAIKESDKHD